MANYLTMLKITCPDGALEFPDDVLASSIYIKNTLIDKHFFGSMSRTKPLFLNFLLDEIRCLVAFIRTGQIALKNAELLGWININPESALHFGIQILKYGRINKFGFVIKTDQLSLQSITDYDAVYSKETHEQRCKILSLAITNSLKKTLMSNKRLIKYLSIEKKLITTISNGKCLVLCYEGKEIEDVLGIYGKQLSAFTKKIMEEFNTDLDNIDVSWSSRGCPDNIQSIQISMPNRMRLTSYAHGFSVSSSSRQTSNIISLNSFIQHVYRYNPLYNELNCETYEELKESYDEAQFVKQIYQDLEKSIEACYEITN